MLILYCSIMLFILFFSYFYGMLLIDFYFVFYYTVPWMPCLQGEVGYKPVAAILTRQS